MIVFWSLVPSLRHLRDKLDSASFDLRDVLSDATNPVSDAAGVGVPYGLLDQVPLRPGARPGSSFVVWFPRDSTAPMESSTALLCPIAFCLVCMDCPL